MPGRGALCGTARLTIRLAIRIERLHRHMANAGRMSVFIVSFVGNELAILRILLDENSNSTSANLGVFVVMVIVPIVVYLISVLLLPWVGRSFH